MVLKVKALYPLLDEQATDTETEDQRLHWARQNVGQLEEVLHTDGTKERFHHDTEGRLLEHRDASGRITCWQYTAAGFIRAWQGVAGQILKYDWDRTGKLASLTNENGVATRFKYDPVGRLLEQMSFDEKATQYHYVKNIWRRWKKGTQCKDFSSTPWGGSCNRKVASESRAARWRRTRHGNTCGIGTDDWHWRRTGL
jgi:YD repeat-containing protein